MAGGFSKRWHDDPVDHIGRAWTATIGTPEADLDQSFADVHEFDARPIGFK